MRGGEARGRVNPVREDNGKSNEFRISSPDGPSFMSPSISKGEYGARMRKSSENIPRLPRVTWSATHLTHSHPMIVDKT